MTEILVADSKDTPSFTRQAIIRVHGLGKQRYEIRLNDRLIKVNTDAIPAIQTPLKFKSNNDYFHFDWKPDLAVNVKVDDELHEATVEINECPVATLAPICDEIYKLNEDRTYAVKIGAIRIDKLLLWHVCTMSGKYFPSNYRIVSADGLRYCCWKSTCTRKGAITKVLFSKRATPKIAPILLAIIITNLIGSPDN